jgi:hypothetical protein
VNYRAAEILENAVLIRGAMPMPVSATDSVTVRLEDSRAHGS